MHPFHQYDTPTKTLFHTRLTQAATALGGANFLLGLIEAIRATKPHGLLQTSCDIRTEQLIMKWNKVVFKDKVDLLETLLFAPRTSRDLLEGLDEKKKKNALNMAKALAPLRVSVKPKNSKVGVGFEVSPFEGLEASALHLDPVFELLFFRNVDFARTVLKYTPPVSS
ncbi:hypothetical protein JWV37_00885 [Sulfurospirillum sp. T05]|uniref:Uncharacterized protein n=1 Tax=Sulfurospirillum tamanense TaxID=2813362 RepID=A0ABS2WNW1_9BACT|nr:hypothetical protein [Sulfurospirillum tamanensis]MBN2963322.1 hypothetical protein [Sulfurospirillum tamanensis]